jgi:hypothetical protein
VHSTWNECRLLARIVKEGVQFWYNDTFTVRGGWGGVGENVPLENLWSLRYFMSVSVPSSFEIFQTRLALWICAAMLLYLINYDIFIQPGTPSKKMSNYNNNENWIYFVSDIVIYFGKLLKIISRFPQNLGVQRRPFFVLGASWDAWTPFWLKAWLWVPPSDQNVPFSVHCFENSTVLHAT